MKKIFKLQGLGCANCAAKMEDQISRLGGVNRVSVNFMTTKMVLEAEDEKLDGILAQAAAIIKKIEPDVKLVKA